MHGADEAPIPTASLSSRCCPDQGLLHVQATAWAAHWVWSCIQVRLPKRKPKVLQPLGVVKLLLKKVDLKTPEAVFCVLK